MVETKFAQGRPDMETLYTIQALQVMRKTPYFAKSVGVVTDVSGKRFKSSLVEIPRNKGTFLFDVLAQDYSIPWDRRAKWARQLVQAVSEAHSKGLVIGTLWYTRTSILVDDLDCIQLWRFAQRFYFGYSGCRHLYPPEFVHLRPISRLASWVECPYITPKTDIFHLGEILWYLAENIPRVAHRSPICEREGCKNQAPSTCGDLHKIPIALPALSEKVPQYFRNIVNWCRAEDRNERPAAWRILEEFPSSDDRTQWIDPNAEASSASRIDISRLKGFGGNISSSISCDNCSQYIANLLFHCNSCNAGDFDMCQACYDKGLHCYENGHLLVELCAESVNTLVSSGNLVSSARYHSSINASGKREVIEL